jgi:hypothetical protein
MRLISIATRCPTVDAFVDLFNRYVDPDDHALFIAARDPRVIGEKAPFQFRLRGGEVVMRGEAEVVRTFDGDDEGPWARSGYCIKLISLEDDDHQLYQRLIEGARSVPPMARRTVPPVVAESHARPLPGMPEPDPSLLLETDINLHRPPTGAPAPPVLLAPIDTPPPDDPDPVWGGLPPPTRRPLADAARQFLLPVRRSKRLQIVVGAIGGMIVGAILAFLTQGPDEEGMVALVPPAAPAGAPAKPGVAPPPAQPETGAPTRPTRAQSSKDRPGKRRPAADGDGDGVVVLDLRSTPRGATFYVDGKKVGRGPVKVSVKAGKRVKVVAKLKGYAEWTDSVSVKDKNKKVSAKLVAAAGRFPKK